MRATQEQIDSEVAGQAEATGAIASHIAELAHESTAMAASIEGVAASTVTGDDSSGAVPATHMPAVEPRTLAEIGRAHVELQSLMRTSYAVFCLKKKNKK